jgi:hypothetical protein
VIRVQQALFPGEYVSHGTCAVQQRRWQTVLNGNKLAELSEFGPLVLNGRQRSVNREVQGSNLRPELDFSQISSLNWPFGSARAVSASDLTAVLRQLIAVQITHRFFAED